MTDTDTAIPQDVRDLAAGIAADIEARGHFQGGEGTGYWTPEHYAQPCCVVQCPSFEEANILSTGSLLAVLHERTGPERVVTWNDTTPTAEVLATLRRIAAGERP